jgi:hypothetical protein
MPFASIHNASRERDFTVSKTDVATAMLTTANENTYSLVKTGGLRKTARMINEVMKNIM